MTGRLLTVAESDSCGASGVQADIKTILALGGYATIALSAVAARDTNGTADLHALDPRFVEQQMRLALEDIGTDAIKTGFLPEATIINAVGTVLDEYQGRNIPVVVDPSILDRNGEQLINEEAIAALKRRLLIRAALLTPNLREAEILTGMTIKDMDDMRRAANMLRTLGAETVLLKSWKHSDEKAVYLLATEGGERIYERKMINSKHTLGAGTTLASAIAFNLTQKMDIFTAVERGIDYMQNAILHTLGFSANLEAGPINHIFLREQQPTRKTASS